MSARSAPRVGHLDPFMVKVVAHAEYYRRLELREKAVARGEAKAVDVAHDATLWDAIVALADETLVVAGKRRVDEIPVAPAAAAAELRAIADRARQSWINDGSPAGARRHHDLFELARLIDDLPRRVALASQQESLT